MNRSIIQTQKRLKYKVVSLAGKELIKTYTRKVAIGYATLLNGLVLNVR